MKTPGELWTEECVLFKGSNSLLSNFNMTCPIIVDDVSYNCTEQYIQSQKAALFDDHETFDWIMVSSNPKDMKLLGTNISKYVHSKWVRVRDQIVAKAVSAKFHSHKNARDVLLATGSRKIGEATKSKHWGIGISIEDQSASVIQNWYGTNVMGTILMDFRDEWMSNPQSTPTADVTDPQSTPTADVAETPEGMTEPQASSSVPVPPGDSQLASSHQPKDWALMLGDSNTRNLQFQDLKVYNVSLHAMGGKTLKDVEDDLNNPRVSPEKIKVVALHVGTCEFGENTKVEKIYTNYVEVINIITILYPHADILVSSIPPRAPRTGMYHGNTAMNADIHKLNCMLENLSRDEEMVSFVDHSSTLYPDGKVDDSFYETSDHTGVHLNKSGVKEISTNICDSLREIFTRQSHGNVWVQKV